MPTLRATGLVAALATSALFMLVDPGPEATPGAPAPGEFLPDLDELTPAALSVTAAGRRGAPRFRLGFRSAVANVGKGPLLVVGRRPSGRVRSMTAEQVVALGDGSTRTYPGVGKLRFMRFSDHRHFHLLGFARYELRRARDGALARPDLKQGFCLTDNDRLRRIADPPEPVYEVGHRDTDCGRGRPRARYLEEGLSVGWTDVYDPHLEGQQIDVTGLPAGAYDLVHRANPDRRLRETSYANNAASVRLRLGWPGGHGAKPAVRVVARCPARARCPPGGAR